MVEPKGSDHLGWIWLLQKLHGGSGHQSQGSVNHIEMKRKKKETIYHNAQSILKRK